MESTSFSHLRFLPLLVFISLSSSLHFIPHLFPNMFQVIHLSVLSAELRHKEIDEFLLELCKTKEMLDDVSRKLKWAEIFKFEIKK